MAEWTSGESLGLSGDPMRDLVVLLSAAIEQCDILRETLNLMEVPIGRWKIMSHAKENTLEMKGELQTLLTKHARVREELRSIGY